MFCPNCGTQLSEGAKFCTNCGFNLTKKQINAENEEKASESVPKATDETIGNKTLAPESPKETNNVNNKHDILWDIIIALIILAGFCLVRILR